MSLSRPKRSSGRANRNRGNVRVCGAHAVRALVDRRFDDVERVHLLQERIPEFSDVLKQCASRRKPYHVVDHDQLERLTKSVHHEGIAVLAAPKRELTLDSFIADTGQRHGPIHVAVLAHVRNPHNLGALLRTAAHFGLDAVVLTGFPDAAGLSTSAYRMSEGGVEAVDIVREDDPHRAVGALRNSGFRVLATAADGEDLFDIDLPERVAAVVGAESEGVSPELMDACDEVISIPGTGAVGSLNVSAATAVVLGELWRRHRQVARPR